MTIPDTVNAVFEAFASVFILNYARVLWNNKQGWSVSLLSTIFFTVWGSWNIWYYAHLGQSFSFWAGIAVVLSNLVWIYVIWRVRQCSLGEII